METVGVLLALVGMVAFVIGAVCVVYPIRRLRVSNRRIAAGVLLAGVVLFAVGGALLPPSSRTSGGTVAASPTATQVATNVPVSQATSVPNANGSASPSAGNATGNIDTGSRPGVPMPDPRLTPGDTFTVTVTQICVSGYSASVRDVPDSEKTQVYAQYGITSHPTGAYEIDHLIPLEIGGSNDIRNLWPQPEQGDAGSLVKDKLENKLHALVCAGQLDLAVAQREIAGDWYSAYLRYVLNTNAPSAAGSPGPVAATSAPLNVPTALPTPTDAAPTATQTAVAPAATAAPAPSQNVVTAGAFCSPGGATGVTKTGLQMVCTTSATDSRNRWRQP